MGADHNMGGCEDTRGNRGSHIQLTRQGTDRTVNCIFGECVVNTLQQLSSKRGMTTLLPFQAPNGDIVPNHCPLENATQRCTK